MTDTARSAREIMLETMRAAARTGESHEMCARRISENLHAAGFHIVATPAVGEVSKEVANLLRSNDLDWSNLSCRQKADRILSLIAPRLKAEGLREAAAIVRPLKLGQFIKHPVGAMAGAADLIEARADAMEKGEA